MPSSGYYDVYNSHDLGKLQDAEKSYRKAIELNPDYAAAYSNLGNILQLNLINLSAH